MQIATPEEIKCFLEEAQKEYDAMKTVKITEDDGCSVILPKSTIVKFYGFPCELTQDTIIRNKTIASMGLDEFSKCYAPDCADNAN